MTTTLMPLVKQQFNQNGVPLAGGKLFVYLAGTTTKATSFTDSTGQTPNTNPVILDSNGQASVWLDPTVYYKFILSPSTDTDPPTNPFWTVDNVISPVPVAVGNMTDEKGSGGTPGFAANVDFTPGTTTSLTLSNNYGSSTNIWVTFDGSEQGADTFSLSGTNNETLTFNAPIPVGVSKVYVKGGSTLSIGSIGSGTVTDSSLASGSKVLNRVKDTVSLSDYSNFATSTDWGPAFQQAINYLQSNGGTLTVPAGYYPITSTITMDRSSNADLGKVNIVGAGSSAVTLAYNGTGILFNISGNPTVSEGETEYTTIQGMYLVGQGNSATTGINSVLTSFCRYVDLRIEGFGYGFYGQDFDHSLFDKVVWRYNIYGMFGRENPTPVANSTDPNQLTFLECHFGLQQQYGLQLANPSNIVFLGGQFEHNGTQAPSAGFGAQFTNGGYQGGAVATFVGTYFESNQGLADCILINTTPTSPIVSDSTYVFNGVTFNRADPSSIATNSILTNFAAPSFVGQQIVLLSGCTFKDFNGYVPSSGRPYLNWSGYGVTKDNLFVSGTVFQAAVESPSYVQNPNRCFVEASKSGTQAIPTGTPSAWQIDTIDSSFSWSTAFSSNGIVIPQTGFYSIDACIAFTSSVTGVCVLEILRNGSLIGYGEATNSSIVCAHREKALTAGDVITLNIIQTSGGTVTAAGSATAFSSFSIAQVINA